MRFLHSKNTILQPIFYRFIDNPALQSLSMTGNLNELTLSYHPTLTENKKRKKHEIIKNELMILPLQTSCELKQNHLLINKLFDIRLSFLDVIQKLKQQDPSFFSRLDRNIENMETDEAPQEFVTEMFGDSPLHTLYFCLNGLRTDSIQHAIELPLKALQKNKLLSQTQLNEIILSVWLRTNTIRQQQEAALASKPLESQFVPYVFRQR